jgi:hypothetical protein
MAYDTAVIRELLTVAFDDESLTILCYDHFHPVYEGFAVGMSKTQKVQALIEHCGRTNQFPDLLTHVQAANPTKYAEFEIRLSVPPQSSSSPHAALLSIPPRRRRRSRSMAQDRNPFHYLRPVPPDEFLGRWSPVKEMAWDLTLDKGDSYACIGGRRFGKSSLLAALHHYLRTPEVLGGDHIVLPLLLDCRGHNFASETVFFSTLLQEVRRRVDAGSRSRPRDPSPVKVPLNQAWLDSLLADDPPGLTLSQFGEALDYILDELYQVDGPTRLVLLLDEVDDTLRYPWHQVLFGQLRSLVYIGDLQDSVRLVLTGSRRFLDEMTERGSPLWNVLKLNYLTAFDRDAIYQLMGRAPGLSEEAQQAVWQQSGGHPFLAQYLLHHLWELGIDEADEMTVVRVANRFLHEEQAHLESWAKAITAIGMQVYGQLVNQPDWVDEVDLIRTVGGQDVSVKRALVDLCYHGFVIHDGDWNRYRYAGELFRQWFLSKYRAQQKERVHVMAPLQPVVAAKAALFLFDIGRWATSELNERWKLTRQQEGAEQATEVDLSKPKEEIEQESDILLHDIAAEHGDAEVERVLGLIERKRQLISEWRESKVDNEEEYNRQRLGRAALRLLQQELDEKISRTLAEIEADLRVLGVQVKKSDQPTS